MNHHPSGSAPVPLTSALKPWVPPACHEEIFVERYDWLRRWALRLSNGDQTQADDLLHNAFLQFVLRRRDLSEIENIEAYLYGLMRRLCLSHARKALRRRQDPLSAADYDTAEMCLPGADVRERLHVEEELRAVCEYACVRKETSKAGSVLILRFFHGYYPKEIARILRGSLRLANDWLRIARLEARTYLHNPSALRFVSQRNLSHGSPHPEAQNGNGHRNNGSNTAASTADILDELRARIRQATSGACLTPADLERLYDSASEETVSSSTLSHIVSCLACLERVSRHLKLGTYSDRDPRDMLGPDGGWRVDKAVSRRANGRKILLRAGADRLRAVVEHRPTELLIAANGIPLGTLKVRSAESDLTLRVNLDEAIDFVEVFSEQDVRMLLFEVEPAPHGEVESVEHVDFAEGRSLGLRVEFTNAWPTLHLAYRDPLLPLITGESEPSIEVPTSVRTLEGPLRERANVGAIDSPPASPDAREWWRRFLGAWRTPFMRPAFGVMSILLAVAVWTTLPWHGRAVSASELLRSARASEQALLTAPGVVVHRVLLLEERRLPERVVRSRRRIELWHDGARGLAVRRVYDERNQLAAGEWTRPDGSQTLYRPGAAPETRQAAPAKSIGADTMWQREPSAHHFDELFGAASPTVEDRGADYVLQYRRELPADAAGLVEATLTIRKAAMRAVAQRLVVRDDGEYREYSFTETALASVPASTVPATAFEPEPELVGRTAPVDMLISAPSIGSRRASVSRRPLLTEEEENRLELDALFAVHRLESCLGEPAELVRTPNGGLRARASATSKGCREHVMATLATVGGPPIFIVDVVVANAPAAPAGASDDGVSELPAYRRLAERFSAAGGVPASDEARAAARAFGQWALARSAAALAEARELGRLTDAWSPARLRALDIDRIAKWLDVVRDHARRLRRESEQVREQLQGLFAIDLPEDSSAPAEPAPLEIRGVDDVLPAVERLVALAGSHDIAMRQMLDAALQSPRVPVDVAALARSLRAAERQATWFDEPWTIESSAETATSTLPSALPRQPD